MDLKVGVIVNLYQICCLVNSDHSVMLKEDFDIFCNNIDVIEAYVDHIFKKYPDLIPVYDEK